MRTSLIRKLVVLTFLFSPCLHVSQAVADKGPLIPGERIGVEEGAQHALITYNGLEELLILETRVSADEQRKIVEFMPLPSEPHVSLAGDDCFKKLQRIVNGHGMVYERLDERKGARGGRAGGGPGVQLAFIKQVGPHDVTVVKVDDAAHFEDWVRCFFRRQNLSPPQFGEEVHRVIWHYLGRDIRFFAFDVVTVSPDERSVRPLAYKFETEKFYYPLVVTNLFDGGSFVELFVITPGGGELNLARQLSKAVHGEDPPLWRSNRIYPSHGELSELHEDIPAMMPGGYPVMTSVRSYGRQFDSDVKSALLPRRPRRLARDDPDEFDPFMPLLGDRWFHKPFREPGESKAGVAPEWRLGGEKIEVPFVWQGKRVIREMGDVMGLLRVVEKQLGAEPQVMGAIPPRLFPFDNDMHADFAESYLTGAEDWVLRVKIRDGEGLAFLRGPSEQPGLAGISGIPSDLLSAIRDEYTGRLVFGQASRSAGSFDLEKQSYPIDFRNTPLAAGLDFIQEVIPLRIVLLERPWPPQTLTLEDEFSGKEFFDRVCDDIGYEWKVDGKTIAIGPPERIDK